MAKLFISLYLFITLALLGLSAGLESVFFPSEPPAQSSTLKQLLNVNLRQNKDLTDLLTKAEINYQLLNLSDIAWPSDSLSQLKKGEALSFYDNQMGEQIYMLNKDNQVIEISLGNTSVSETAFVLYRSLFFILLGGLIALWLWPLWHDLEALKKSVSVIMPDGNISENKVSKSSLVAPIALSLNNMRAQIATLMQNQRELSGAVAHEFRTPLARLKFALGMQDDSENSMIKDMQQDVAELEKLIQEMLDLTTSDVQTPTLHFAEIPIANLCQNLVDKFKLSHLSLLDVSVKADTGSMRGDGHFIERAIENLLLNAARYAKARIAISTQLSQHHIDIFIEDDGAGVKAEFREKIFDPFFRPDEARTRLRGGAGLGLAIVKRVVQWHSGTCWVSESQWGGAKFTLRFPI